MDPITHIVAGAAAAALAVPETAGLSPLIPIAVGVAASLTPDLDFITKQFSQAAFLRHHHGITHGISSAALQGALVALVFSAIFGLQFYVPLLIAALAAEATHLILDMLLHSNGIAILSPFSERRFSLPILLGINPLTALAQCHRQNIAICTLCQFNSAIRNPMPLVLFVGTVLGAMDFEHVRIYAGACVSFMALWYLLAVWARVMAKRHLHRLGDFTDWELLGPFPANFYLTKWLGVFRRDDVYETVIIQLGRKGLLSKFYYGKNRQGSHLEEAKQSSMRQTFETAAYVPFETEKHEQGGYKISWLDLSHALDPNIELFSLHVHLDEQGHLLRSAFRERWNPAVED
jgi:membrane-bound metal-dependent hydrolase YbcI (DUF457 family)